MSEELLLVGLGDTGASVGLALKQAGVEAVRVGYDQNTRTAKSALKAGAVDRLVHRLETPEGCDLVILSVPPSLVQESLAAVFAGLPEGAIILDASPLKSAALAWVTAELPAGRHYVGAVPIPAGVDLSPEAFEEVAPHADRFKGGLLALVVPPGCPEEVVEVALSVGRVLGADPFFIEAAELDGVAATVEALPALVGAALMRLASDSPGWREARRIAGTPFARNVSVAGAQSAEEMGASLALNRANTLAKLDLLVEELGRLRQLIASGKDDVLAEELGIAIKAYDDWLRARAHGDWGAEERRLTGLPDRSGILNRWLGRRPGRRPDRK
jgi:prephenate dehydrogenase